MFRYDLGHSGAITPNNTQPEGILKWACPTGDAIHSSAVIANGIVYVGSNDGRLYAIK